MTTTAEINGECLCGKVRFAVAAPKEIGLCHCGMCRKWGGGMPLAAFHGKISLHSSESLRWYKSSEWLERGFCGECGSSLFCRAAGEDDWVVSAGATNPDSARIVQHIYIEEKPAFYDFADNAPRITGAQFVAGLFAQMQNKFGDAFLQDALPKVRRENGDAFADEVEKILAANKTSS